MSDKLKGYDYSFGPKRRESSSTQGDQTSFFNAQNVAQPILAKLIHTWLHWRKVVHKFALFLTFSKKTTQRKQPPNKRKFAQSGHPGSISIRVV
jgi:hypothetical protein